MACLVSVVVDVHRVRAAHLRTGEATGKRRRATVIVNRSGCTGPEPWVRGSSGDFDCKGKLTSKKKQCARTQSIAAPSPRSFLTLASVYFTPWKFSNFAISYFWSKASKPCGVSWRGGNA